MRTVFERKEVEGALVIGTAQVLYQRLINDAANGSIAVVEVTDDLLVQFEKVTKSCFAHGGLGFVRTVDGLHLASAFTSGETHIVATDKRLRDAAKVLGPNVSP